MSILGIGRIRYSSFVTTRQRHKKFDDAIISILRLKYMIRSNRSLFQFNNPQRKPDTPFMEYQPSERRVERRSDNDRAFPVDTVTIQQFRTEHDTELEEATIHTGTFADEYARLYNALAVTIGNDIYFRDGAYNPASEEGRKTLAHELTHVGQFTEERVTKNITEKELEAEAEQAERHEEHIPDPYVKVDLNGKYFTLLKSEMTEFAYGIAEKIEEWIKGQKIILEESEYQNLLYGLEDWLMEAS